MAKYYIHDQAIAKAEAKLRARTRRYPVFKPGMTVAEYAEEYYALNAMRWVPTSFGIRCGAYTAMHDIVRLRGQVEAFFAPLSKEPQYLRDDTVTVEEVAA